MYSIKFRWGSSNTLFLKGLLLLSQLTRFTLTCFSSISFSHFFSSKIKIPAKRFKDYIHRFYVANFPCYIYLFPSHGFLSLSLSFFLFNLLSHSSYLSQSIFLLSFKSLCLKLPLSLVPHFQHYAPAWYTCTHTYI